MKIVRLNGPFARETGFAFCVPLPPETPSIEDGAQFSLVEGDDVLASGNSSHDDIRTTGRGGFSVWPPQLYFSTSDNTDPNENGRHYWLIATEGQPSGRGPDRLETPENYKPRDLSTIDTAADYAVACGRSYLQQARRFGVSLDGARVLEIGPGSDFGAALILACHGARVSVADRFIPPWDTEYHPALYRRMLERWDGPNDALKQAAEGLCPCTIIHRSAEELADVPGLTDSFDIVYSMAVFEHLSDVGASCLGLARVTAPGALNVHQVDFRDHDSFDRPLEFLCEEDDAFAKKFIKRVAETGNRVRPSELVGYFRDAGLDLVEPPYPTERASEEYLAGFLPRLRASPSRYAQWPAEDLKITSALCITRRRR